MKIHAAFDSLLPVPCREATLFADAGDRPLSGSELWLLRDHFAEHHKAAVAFLEDHHVHVYIPLSRPEDTYHVAFSGRYTMAEIEPFFQRRPNALTVVDGRSCGFFRLCFLHVDDDFNVFRVADVEVHTAALAEDTGFEMFYEARDGHETRIRHFDFMQFGSDGATGQLVQDWAAHFKAMRKDNRVRPLVLGLR